MGLPRESGSPERQRGCQRRNVWFTTAQEAPAPDKLAASPSATAYAAAPNPPSAPAAMSIEDMTPEFFG
ncbi:MAG: hypothetical protein QNI87_11275 [Erythrobacter sp.]|nr:hypothetical protein [Erythrobacter sp.]